MKFLIVGFTGVAQQEIEQMLEHELFGHCYESVPIQHSANLEPILPQVSAKETQSDFCIIDLDGIGQHQLNDLLKILANRPAIFVGRQMSQGLKVAIKHSTQIKIELLEKPYEVEQLHTLLLKAIRLDSTRPKQSIYTTTQMNDSTKLYVEPKVQVEKASIYTSNAVPSVRQAQQVKPKKVKDSIYESKPLPFGQTASQHNTTQTTVKKAKTKASIYTADETPLKPKQSTVTQTVHLLEHLKDAKLLLNKVWVNFAEYEIYEQLFDAFAQKEPCLVCIGNDDFLVDAKENSIILPNLFEFLTHIEQLEMAQRLQLKVQTKNIKDNYQHLSQVYVQNQYQRYPLNLFLWQFYHQFLAEELHFSDYELRLKIKEMPKFIEMETVPSYMYTVVSSCLQKSQDIEQLQQTQKFSFLNITQMQRVYLLAILAHYADIEIMQNLLERKAKTDLLHDEQQALSSSSSERNRNIFKRILGKF